VFTFVVVWFNIDLGAMKHATPPPLYKAGNTQEEGSVVMMLLPIVFMVIGVFVFLYLTGDGDIFHGSGSSSIFYTMITTLIFLYGYYVLFGDMRSSHYLRASLTGAKKLFPIALVLLFAFAIGKITSQLHTGEYLASLIDERGLSVHFLSPFIFILSGIIAFATGTSWGTFSIMVPIAVAMAVGVDANVALALGAVMSGGVFGDHCSPISDTTIISSLASDCDVVEHVSTQLPYALVSGCIALVLFFIFSYL
jgi:Na+/H+ antiporter NhaC